MAYHLRKQNEPRYLSVGKPVGNAGLNLPRGHAEDRSTKRFGEISAENKADRQRPGGKRVDVDISPAIVRRQIVEKNLPAIKHHQHHQEIGQSPHNGGIGMCQAARGTIAVNLGQSANQAEGAGNRKRRRGDAECNPEPGQDHG
ncbi:hypothetical protein D3C72_1805240 [compost metagenome]